MKTYIGNRWQDGDYSSPNTVTVVDSDGRSTVQYPLEHVVRHSPTGFSWGYAGSGPSDLARSLVIDALGDRARCKRCDGTGEITYTHSHVLDGEQVDLFESAEAAYAAGSDAGVAELVEPQRESCGECFGDGYSSVVQRCYQLFKFAYVANFEDSFTITDQTIREFIADCERKQAETAAGHVGRS